VTKLDLGSKRLCLECGARFYDLKKKSPECPKCGTVCEEPKPRPKRSAPAAKAQVAEKAVPAAPPPPADEAAAEAQDPALNADNDRPFDETDGVDVDEADDEELDDADSDDELIEDASDLGKDTDDVSEVMEHVDDGVGDKG